MLWSGTPRRVLDLVRSDRLAFYTSEPLLDELRGVLSRDKFTERFRRLNTTPHVAIREYESFVTVVVPATIRRVVAADPTDDEVFACAKSAQADYIVSGDLHLTDLGSYDDIPIVFPSLLLALFPPDINPT
ncbi:MAG: putative toxin-antitoxin system toxin component, PIN family [Candidatus Poribacteria bacterium]|nr:putative toxin-antitoxin system toxin component, PIN family [Candidatus Poribacteria bacterium]